LDAAAFAVCGAARLAAGAGSLARLAEKPRPRRSPNSLPAATAGLLTMSLLQAGMYASGRPWTFGALHLIDAAPVGAAVALLASVLRDTRSRRGNEGAG